MTRFLSLAIAFFCALIVSAQMGSSINQQNMKIPRGNKPEPVKSEPSQQERPSYEDNIDTNTTYYNLFDSAQNAIAERNYSLAEDFLNRAIASDPTNENNSLLLSNLATIQRYQGKLTEALKNYNLAIDLTPNATTLLLNRAALLNQIDSVSYAISDYQRVINLDPSNAEALFSHGMLSLQTGNDSIANEDFQTLLGYNPNSGLAYEGLGNLHKYKKNYAKAIQCFSEVIKVQPSASLLANRADCYLMLQKLNEASEDIQQALKLDPSDGLLYLLRAKLNKMRFNYSDMESDKKLAAKYGIPASQIEKALK